MGRVYQVNISPSKRHIYRELGCVSSILNNHGETLHDYIYLYKTSAEDRFRK